MAAKSQSLAGLFLRGSRTPAFRAGVPGCVPGAVSSSIAPPITLDIITFVPIDRLSTLLRLILGGADAGTWKRNNSAKAWQDDPDGGHRVAIAVSLQAQSAQLEVKSHSQEPIREAGGRADCLVYCADT